MVSEIEDILAAGFTPTTDADWETLDLEYPAWEKARLTKPAD